MRRTRSTERGHVGAIAPAQDQEVVLALQVVAKGQTEPAVLVLAAVPYRHKPERLNGDVLVNRVQVGKPEQLQAPVLHQDVHRRVLREGGAETAYTWPSGLSWYLLTYALVSSLFPTPGRASRRPQSSILRASSMAWVAPFCIPFRTWL